MNWDGKGKLLSNKKVNIPLSRLYIPKKTGVQGLCGDDSQYTKKIKS